jgi:hypothetical protein
MSPFEHNRIMKQVDAGTRYETVETVRAQLDEVLLLFSS